MVVEKDNNPEDRIFGSSLLQFMTGLAAIGAVAGGGRSKVFSLPSYFCLVNAAALAAAWNVVRSRRIDLWEPQRSAVEGPE